MKKITLLLFIILFIFSISAEADRGSIPFIAGVYIFEPSQDALIAWNGKEEILILSTELYASEKTKVLQVLPLPSEPEIKESSRGLLRRANEFLFMKELNSFSQPGFRSSRSDTMPGGEVKDEIVIGSHDVSVVEVKNQVAFIDWVNNHLKEKGEDNPIIPTELQQSINNYIDQGYNFFVFDTIEVKAEAEFNEAISYKFKSDLLYYPLEITKSDQGVSDIRLILISDQNLVNYSGIAADRINVLAGPIQLAYEELYYISPKLADLFYNENRKNNFTLNEIEISTWQIIDDLSNFDDDLLVSGQQ